jgi:NtrC-family two-component system sensor histidine kinase KinB
MTMRMRHLQTRFILAGCLLVLITVGSSLWSALSFARLSAVVGDALRGNQEIITLATELAGSLEREDDALLLALSGDRGPAARALAEERRRGDDSLGRLVEHLNNGGGLDLSHAVALRRDIDAYRTAGSDLVASADRDDTLGRYHTQVNPLLRRAVAACAGIRDEGFRAIQQAGVRARDEAGRAIWIVAALSAAAVVAASLVAVWLAHAVVPPIRDLTASADAVRQGNFDRRVAWSAEDELGQLAEGFNRMAETLGEYRASSLGELLTAKMTLESTLDALPDAVLVIAPDGTLAATNPPARALLEALRVPQATRLKDLPLRPEHREAVDAALAGRASVPTRTEFGLALTATLNGRPRRFLLAAVPIPEFAPRRCGAVIVLDDVTDIARLDELRGELIGMASHELKSPLTSLQLNLLLLEEEAAGLTPPQREMLDAALHGCKELGATIDELLDVTRAEAGRLRLDLAPVDLDALADQVLRGLRPRFADAGVSVKVVHEVERPVVRGDAARLGNVLTNLLVNALKYSPHGGHVVVRISSGQTAGTAGLAPLQVAVTDEGPGIPAEFRERVFEKFFRVEHHLGANRKAVRGTGIGLYLCREILKAHGGAIWCEPGDGGRGTRVAFTLPPAQVPG